MPYPKNDSARTGARSRAEIPKDVLRQLNAGVIETKTLSEGLAIDFPKLILSCKFDKPYPNVQAHLAASVGIKTRMRRAGEWIAEEFGQAGIDRFSTHPSDTVRGWVCYALALLPACSIQARLKMIQPFADDPHFGVREWAWIAIRDELAVDLKSAIQHLKPWVEHRSENLRRFAIEVLRPRGVWCSHIPELKENPELARHLLEEVKADPEKYVQDSVANWLNDASKTQPEWVQRLCATWRSNSPGIATERICHRGLRSVRKIKQP